MGLKHLESIDSGSNYAFGDKMIVENVRRSLFSLSHLNSMTIKNAGIVVPVSVIPTLPNDSMDIYIDCLLRVMPQVVPLYSRQRLYVYGFYSRGEDLYKNFNVLMTKGYSGNVVKSLPTLHGGKDGHASGNVVQYVNVDASYHLRGDRCKIRAESLGDYMGLPIGADCLVDQSTSGEFAVTGLYDGVVSALPFMMYMRVWRDFFINRNHFISDRVILPDDDADFRLNDEGNLISAANVGKRLQFDVSADLYHNFLYTTSELRFGLFTHLYPSDYFTSALPFTQRGTPTPLQSDVSNLQAVTDTVTKTVLDFSKVVGGDSGYSFIAAGDFHKLTTGYLQNTPNGPIFSEDTSAHNKLLGALNQTVATSTSTSTTNITGRASLSLVWDDIRRLAFEQEELEKMARTDGSYGDFGLTFFGRKSKTATDYKPVYIGGIYKNISFTEVLQTSGSSVGTTDPSSSSPLGAMAGHGITGMSDNYLGHIDCDDFGYIMILACIMPDVYYSQGLDKHFTRLLQSEMYLPERARLGLQPILNQELYYQGDNGSEQGEDKYLWAYQNPFDDYRYLPNRIHGKIADPDNKTFFPYTQSRKFSGLPNWGFNFSEAVDVRKDYLYSKSESAYSAQFGINIRAVRPLPYKPIPATL